VEGNNSYLFHPNISEICRHRKNKIPVSTFVIRDNELVYI